MVCLAWARLASLEATKGRRAAVAAALEQAIHFYNSVRQPTARFVTLQAVLKHGSADHVAWATQVLEAFDPATLTHHLRQAYEALRRSIAERPHPLPR